jgi:hypothetical protein
MEADKVAARLRRRAASARRKMDSIAEKRRASLANTHRTRKGKESVHCR